MATVNFIKCRRQNVSSLIGTINYVIQESKVSINTDFLSLSHSDTFVRANQSAGQESENVQLITGLYCSPESVINEFMATKNVYNKNDGVMFYHYTQSFSSKENILTRLLRM